MWEHPQIRQFVAVDDMPLRGIGSRFVNTRSDDRLTPETADRCIACLSGEFRKVLLVVDMQPECVYGACGTQESERIVPGVVSRLTEAAQDVHTVIIRILDNDSENRTAVQKSEDRDSSCRIFGWDGEIREIRQASGDQAMALWKGHFGSLGLPDRVPAETEEIEIAGVQTDTSVIANALILRSAFPDKRILVRESLCAGTTKKAHREALDIMRSCLIDVV